jgi:hypothetical protein
MAEFWNPTGPLDPGQQVGNTPTRGDTCDQHAPVRTHPRKKINLEVRKSLHCLLADSGQNVIRGSPRKSATKLTKKKPKNRTFSTRIT